MAETTAQACTRLLRESSDPLYVRLRTLLGERGLDAGRVALATLFPDDTHLELGVVVTADGRVHEFELYYGSGDLGGQARTATIPVWCDRTEQWRDSPYRDDVVDALALLAAEGGSTDPGLAGRT